MGKHRRPGPPNQPSRVVPQVDDDDPLVPYDKRRVPPMDEYRRHRALRGGGGHLLPGEPRAMEEWDGFAYVPVGIASDLATARAWVRELDLGTGGGGT